MPTRVEEVGRCSLPTIKSSSSTATLTVKEQGRELARRIISTDYVPGPGVAGTGLLLLALVCAKGSVEAEQ